MALNSGKDEETKTIQLEERIIFLTNSIGATGVSCAKKELGPLFMSGTKSNSKRSKGK